MGRGRVRDFRTSWWCCARSFDFWYKLNECENAVQAPCLWSNLLMPYILSEHFFFLFRKTSLYLEEMTSELRNKGQLKPNAIKNTSFVGLYKCCELKYWQKIDQKWNTIYWLKTVYDDYIIKWPLKHRIVLSINKLWQKIVTEMVQQAGCPHWMSRELAWCVSITINSNSNYKLTQKIIEFMWLNLFYFSAFLLGFQKLGEQTDISSSYRQRLFVFLFLDKLVNGFLQSGKAKDFSFSHYLVSSGNFLEILSKPKI